MSKERQGCIASNLFLGIPGVAVSPRSFNFLSWFFPYTMSVYFDGTFPPMQQRYVVVVDLS